MRLLPNEPKEYYTLKNLIKIIRADFGVLTKGDLKEFIRRLVNHLIKILKHFFLVLFILAKIVLWPVLPSIKKRLFERKLGKKREIPADLTNLAENTHEILDVKVSVVINTKNSPPYFDDLLKKYKFQTGLREIEIILVDSGSTDATLKIAKSLDCKVIEIKPEEFRHGRSRNIGIKAATGDFIVNAVSDATPSSLNLLYKVVKKLESSGAGAVSIRQVPRNDADVFATWNIYNHYEAMFGGFDGDIWIDGYDNLNALSSFEKRKLCVIDDVFVMHKASLIKKELYDNEIRYAEDLDLSMRYLKKGIKIGFLNSEAVIHSHTRESEYFLKRYFVDTNIISEIFSSLPENFKGKKVFPEGLAIILNLQKEKLEGLGENVDWLEKYTKFFTNKTLGDSYIKQTWESFFNNNLTSLKKFPGLIGDLENSTQSKLASLTSGVLLSEYFSRLGKGSKELESFKSLMEGGV